MQSYHFLKVGTLAENIRKRSVLNKFSKKNETTKICPGVGRCGGRFAITSDTELVVATGAAPSGKESHIRRLFCCVRNDLLCMGATPTGFLYNLISDEGATEEGVRKAMQNLEQLAKQYEMDFFGGEVQVSRGIKGMVSSLTLFGEVGIRKRISNAALKPGMDVVMTKSAGIAGTVWLTENDVEERLSRLPEDMLENAKKFGEALCGQGEAEIAWNENVTAMQHTSQGGLFGDLWNFAEASGVGLVVDLKAIPIRQETIEICEVFNKNPYMIPAGGSFLMGTYHGEELVEKMQAKGFQAAVIGRVLEGKERVVMNGDEKRALLPHNNEKEGNIYEIC